MNLERKYDIWREGELYNYLLVYGVVMISIEVDAFRQSYNMFKSLEPLASQAMEPAAGKFLPKRTGFSAVEKQSVYCSFLSVLLDY